MASLVQRPLARGHKEEMQGKEGRDAPYLGRGHLCDFLVPIQQVSFPGLASLCNPHTGCHKQVMGAELNYKVHSLLRP